MTSLLKTHNTTYTSNPILFTFTKNYEKSIDEDLFFPSFDMDTWNMIDPRMLVSAFSNNKISERQSFPIKA